MTRPRPRSLHRSASAASYTPSNFEATHTIAVAFALIAATPAAVTDLVASQVLSGNDGDGTTKIQVSFTAIVADASLAPV